MNPCKQNCNETYSIDSLLLPNLVTTIEHFSNQTLKTFFSISEKDNLKELQ